MTRMKLLFIGLLCIVLAPLAYSAGEDHWACVFGTDCWTGSVLYYGRIGAAGATARVAATYVLADVNWTEVYDPGAQFDTASGGADAGDVICYRGDGVSNVHITLPISSFTSAVGRSTTSFGIAPSVVGNGDEVGEPMKEDFDAVSEFEMGQLEIVHDLDTDDCIGILFLFNVAASMTYEHGTITISQ